MEALLCVTENLTLTHHVSTNMFQMKILNFLLFSSTRRLYDWNRQAGILSGKLWERTFKTKRLWEFICWKLFLIKLQKSFIFQNIFLTFKFMKHLTFLNGTYMSGRINFSKNQNPVWYFCLIFPNWIYKYINKFDVVCELLTFINNLF